MAKRIQLFSKQRTLKRRVMCHLNDDFVTRIDRHRKETNPKLTRGQLLDGLAEHYLFYLDAYLKNKNKKGNPFKEVFDEILPK